MCIKVHTGFVLAANVSFNMPTRRAITCCEVTTVKRLSTMLTFPPTYTSVDSTITPETFTAGVLSFIIITSSLISSQSLSISVSVLKNTAWGGVGCTPACLIFGAVMDRHCVLRVSVPGVVNVSIFLTKSFTSSSSTHVRSPIASSK